MRDLTEPVTERGQRVLAILRAAHAGQVLAEFRREHGEWWPRGLAGDRKWARDCADALRGRVYGVHDEVTARRVRLLEWLEEHGPATTAQVEAAMGYPSRDHTWADLMAAGAVVARVLLRPDGRGGRQNVWVVENLAPQRARTTNLAARAATEAA